jgi:hypothetical protein
MGYIPNGIMRFLNWPNPSSHALGLGLTQPLAGMSTRNLSLGEGQFERKADNLRAISEPIV